MENKPSFIKQLFKVAAMVFVVVASFFGSLLALMVFFIALGVALSAGSEVDLGDELLETRYGDPASDHVLVSIPINGVILGDRDEVSDFFEVLSELEVTYGYEVKEQLMELAEDNEAKGVILEINSPGGTIYGSQAIADGVAYYQQETGKPVYAFVSSFAASGGYWAAAGADEIIADQGSGIGSIGIINGPLKYYDEPVSEGSFLGSVETTGGIETNYITSGRSKDLGNPYRQATEQELAVLQQGSDQLYEIFVQHVADNRELSEATIKDTIGAMVYTNVQAQELGLIDATASRDEAYAQLASRTGEAGEDFQVQRRRVESGFFNLLSSSLYSATHQPQASNRCIFANVALVYHGDVAALCE